MRDIFTRREKSKEKRKHGKKIPEVLYIRGYYREGHLRYLEGVLHVGTLFFYGERKAEFSIYPKISI